MRRHREGDQIKSDLVSRFFPSYARGEQSTWGMSAPVPIIPIIPLGKGGRLLVEQS